MALEGSLKEFGLADILQLLYFQKKTGALVVEGRFDRVKILFKDGNIVAIESRRRLESNRLGRIMIKKGLLTQEELDELLKQQPLTGLRLGEMLVKKGLPAEVITDCLTKQITETLIQVLQWKEGYYEFKPEGISLSKELPISLDTQHILMEGLRVLDEYSVIGEKVSPHMVFEPQKVVETVTDLSESEQRVLDLINGENDLSTIVELSGMEELEVSRIILRLLEKGIIREKKEEEFISEIPEEKKEFKKPLSYSIFIWFLIIASLVFSFHWFRKFKDDIYIIQAIKDLEALREEIEQTKLLSIVTGGVSNRGGKGTAEEEYAQRFVNKKDPWGNPYIYRQITAPEMSSPIPIVFSSGPDRRPDTEDDIW